LSTLRDHRHRYWFTFHDPPEASFFALGCGVTAVDREDAERLLLDVLPNMGDPSIRGVWFPRG
jgi:hypothetical protein